MITIKQVKTHKERKEFVNFPLKMFKNNPYFVPPIYMDEMKIFKKNYYYHEQCDDIFFNAYIDGKMVGRIQGIIQRVSNAKDKCKKVRFTRFDAIDNQEVADALFKAVEDWARFKGMDTMEGPLGYSDLEHEGLLIEGFDQISTTAEIYNFDYYQKLIENCGYNKQFDWEERILRSPKEKSDRLERISRLMLRRCHLHYGTAKNTKEFLKKYSDGFFKLLDETYKDLPGTVPFTKKMKDEVIKGLSLILNMKYVCVILNEKEEVVCFGMCFPSFGKALQKTSGHLTPGCISRVLKSVKNPKTIELGLVGVDPQYAMMGIASNIIYEVQRMLETTDIEFAETNLNLETNDAIIAQWKNFDATLHKRRRCYIKSL